MKSTKPQWCRYQSHTYQCWETTATEALIVFPSYTAPGWVDVALNGPPALVPAMAWVLKSKVFFYPEDVRSRPLPVIPFSDGLQVGSRVKWGTSLAEWAVVSLDSEMTKIRQVSGWATDIVFDAPVAELSGWQGENIQEQRAA